jgi:outer membrane receptor for ferric coprogen and ferric-rhodotorulic acid
MNAIASLQQLLRRLALLGYCAVLPVVFAQSAPTKEEKSAAPTPKVEEETLVLNPFVVSTEGDKGYRATNSISGSRLDTAIKDIPMPIEVITEEFMKDTGARDLRQGLRYSAGIQLQSQNDYGSPGGAYQGSGGVNNPEGATANRSQSSIKIRGFVTESVLRDGYLRQNSTDSINIGRIEVVRGPAALLYGVGNFGGIVNYLPKLPEAKLQSSIGVGLGSYNLKRVTLDTTGPVSNKWDFNYRFTGAWEEADDYTQYKNSTHRFLSPVFSFRPTKTTEVVIDYENGTARDEGLGFLRVRSAIGPGPNAARNEDSSFYTLPGTDARTFRWSGPDTYLDTKVYNLRLQVTQRIMENLNLLVGYNNSRVNFGKLDAIGNLQPWTDQFANADTAFGLVPFIPIDQVNGTSNLGVGNPTAPNRATLAYRWIGDDTQNDRDQVRAELVYKFKLFEDSANKWLRMDNMIMVGRTDMRIDNEVTNFTSAFNSTGGFSWVTNYYNPTNANPLRFGQKQPNGTPELPYLKSRGSDASTWNQGNYAVFQGKLLDDRLTVVSGARKDRNETKTINVTYLRNGPPTTTTASSPTQRQTTYQNGASYQINRAVSVYALKSAGLQPNFTGNRDTNGNPLPATLAKSKELGVKIDLFNGKLTGTISAFDIKRTNSPIFYWWAPTSNYGSRFNPAKDIVYRVNQTFPSSVGGPTWTNGAANASLTQWNAGVAAGTIYQIGSNWYVNASKATGAAYLDNVFKFTFDNGSSWPGWLYDQDANTNNAWDTRASGPDGNEYVLGSDSSTGWDTQLMFTPNQNLQLVVSYSHVKRVVDSAGNFAKSPVTGDRWAVWYFPNTDWGLTRVPTANAYTTPGDSSTWTGTNWGQGLPMDDTPEHAFSAWANYNFTQGMFKGFSVGVGGQYESPRLYLSGLTKGSGEQMTDKNGNPVMLRTRASKNVSMMVRYNFKLADRDASVQLNVDNVLNDQKLYGLLYKAPTSARVEFVTKF